MFVGEWFFVGCLLLFNGFILGVFLFALLVCLGRVLCCLGFFGVWVVVVWLGFFKKTIVLVLLGKHFWKL